MHTTGAHLQKLPLILDTAVDVTSALLNSDGLCDLDREGL